MSNRATAGHQLCLNYCFSDVRYGGLRLNRQRPHVCRGARDFSLSVTAPTTYSRRRRWKRTLKFSIGGMKTTRYRFPNLTGRHTSKTVRMMLKTLSLWVATRTTRYTHTRQRLTRTRPGFSRVFVQRTLRNHLLTRNGTFSEKILVHPRNHPLDKLTVLSFVGHNLLGK